MSRNKLEDLKQEHNLKSKELAEMLSISESKYSEWEKDKVPIPTKRLIQLANYYKVNIDYILNLTKNKKYYNTKKEINLETIGNRLYQIRNEQKLSLRELEKRINCSFSSIAAYERGERLIVSYALINLAKLGNYSIDWILDRSNNKYIK